MSATRFSIAVSCAAILTACQMSEAPNAAVSMSKGPDACGASELDYLIGMRANEIDFSTTTASVRIIAPNSAVTMDHRPDRLNVHTDGNDVITKLSCG